MRNMRKTGILLTMGLWCTGWLFASGTTEVTFHRATLPVLSGESLNHVGYIRLVKEHDTKDCIREVTYTFDGTDCLGDIEEVAMYPCSRTGKADGTRLLAVSKVSALSGSWKLRLPLQADTCYYSFAVKTKSSLPLSGRMNFHCTGVLLDSGEKSMDRKFREGLRTGVALRKKMQDGVNTSRIPGLTTSVRGTLLAIYDARWDSSRDLQGDMDIALNRSEDGGKTWSSMQRILDQKQWGNLPEKYNGVSDACILSDERTGTIYVAGLWMHGVLDGHTGRWVEGLTEDSVRWNHQWRDRGSQPGTGVRQTAQFLITRSTDDGKTWSEPVNITAETKREEWWLFAPAPGHGITLEDGTLVFPSQGRDRNGLPFSNLTYSRDGGKTWETSNPAYSNTTECMAVQLDNGDIMLNMRDNRNHGIPSPNGRRVCVTSDLGKTWKEHATSHRVLTEPTCMASIHKHVYRTKEGEKKTLLAFVNPDNYDRRDRLTLKLSFDNGMTWPQSCWLMLDEWGGAGYSCITSVDEHTLGIVYEGSGAQLIFQQIDLSPWL